MIREYRRKCGRTKFGYPSWPNEPTARAATQRRSVCRTGSISTTRGKKNVKRKKNTNSQPVCVQDAQNAGVGSRRAAVRVRHAITQGKIVRVQPEIVRRKIVRLCLDAVSHTHSSAVLFVQVVMADECVAILLHPVMSLFAPVHSPTAVADPNSPLGTFPSM